MKQNLTAMADKALAQDASKPRPRCRHHESPSWANPPREVLKTTDLARAFGQFVNGCRTCGAGKDNKLWVCLTCHVSCCGNDSCPDFQTRMKHFRETGHPIDITTTTLEPYCWKCSTFPKNEVYGDITDAAYRAFNGHDRPEAEKQVAKLSPGAVLRSIKGFEDKWKLFQDKTDQLLRSCLTSFGGANDLPGINKGIQGPITPQVSDDEKHSVFGGREFTVELLARELKRRRFKNIIVMSGAGISTSANIPDFRTPGTGLYDNLQKYDLPFPQAIFDLRFFKEKPEPFFTLAKELYPGRYNPTPTHCFIKLLHDKGLLLRNYTQNIDNLERQCELPAESLVEAHGSFSTAHCLEPGCGQEYSCEDIRDTIFSGLIPRCSELDCAGIVKPDIVFFGESLPPRFVDLHKEDFAKCDLLLIMGTSLQVQPFAGLMSKVSPTTPRVLVNMEKVNVGTYGGFVFEGPETYRDLAVLGKCDDQVHHLATRAGWGPDLLELQMKYGLNFRVKKGG